MCNQFAINLSSETKLLSIIFEIWKALMLQSIHSYTDFQNWKSSLISQLLAYTLSLDYKWTAILVASLSFCQL